MPGLALNHTSILVSSGFNSTHNYSILLSTSQTMAPILTQKFIKLLLFTTLQFCWESLQLFTVTQPQHPINRVEA